jgi:molybdopterin converting factor small subunit
MADVKKISIRLAELNRISNSLSKIITQDLPIKQAFRLSRLAKSVDTEMQELETQRVALVKKYGEKDESGNVSVKGKLQEFIDEFNELLKEEVEISFIPINLNDVGDIKLSAMDIGNLEVFLDNTAILNPTETVGENVVDTGRAKMAQHKKDMIM